MTRSPRRPDDRRVDPLLEVRERRRGKRPGDAYVRIVRPFDDVFEKGGDEGELIATERTVLGRSGWHGALRQLRTWLIGRPIHSEREGHERLTKVKALAIFSSDNISSSAYATEEIMRVLALAGVGAISLTLPLAGLITVMLAIVTVSYRQTIKAYPNGASSYIVASDNLGSMTGVLAAAALLIGYVVTVAVSVSAGVAALTSIVDELFAQRVLISVGLVVLLMLGNLRGIRESGTIFMIPTYFYIVIMLGIIAYGVMQTLSGSVAAYVPPESWEGVEQGGQALALFLILRAFSQGAVALTGVEAISDGVPAFKSPEWRNARTTLTWAATIFAVLFLGIAFLVVSIGIVPDPFEKQTVLSQLVRHLTGDGVILVIAQVATALLLVLAANTSFADFPRLSSILARDGYMPRQFAFRGERLAFTIGIVTGTSVFHGRPKACSDSCRGRCSELPPLRRDQRAPAKTQASLLEAMQRRESRSTARGIRAPRSVHCVFATQNPIDHEGTFPLPEAQLDRFLFKDAHRLPPAAEVEARLLPTPRTASVVRDRRLSAS